VSQQNFPSSSKKRQSTPICAHDGAVWVLVRTWRRRCGWSWCRRRSRRGRRRWCCCGRWSRCGRRWRRIAAYQWPFSLNCVDVQPHFLRQSVIQPPFLRRIWHRSLTRTIDQRPFAKSTCGRAHKTARAHHHRAALRRQDSRCKDEAAVHFSIRRSMSPRTNGQTIMIAKNASSFSQGSSGRDKPKQV